MCFEKLPNFTLILLDENSILQYSNVNQGLALDVLSSINSNELLNYNNPHSRIYGSFFMTTQNVNIKDMPLNLIILERIHCFNSAFAQMIFTDSLSGLYSRNFWQHLTQTYRFASPFNNSEIVLLDIDNLKQINDHQGHLAGDEAIRLVGKAIRSSIRDSDIAVRYAGDEFLIFLSCCGQLYVEKIINRIKSNLVKECKTVSMNVSVSAGHCCCNRLDDLPAAIKKADEDMYQEKKLKPLFSFDKDLKAQISFVCAKLNKLFENEETFEVTEEIKDLSQKLDELIAKYQRKLG